MEQILIYIGLSALVGLFILVGVQVHILSKDRKKRSEPITAKDIISPDVEKEFQKLNKALKETIQLKNNLIDYFDEPFHGRLSNFLMNCVHGPKGEGKFELDEYEASQLSLMLRNIKKNID